MRFTPTDIPDVVLIEPKVFADDRGYFFESFSQKEFEANIGRINFVQDNESKSSYGVLRGLHYQLAPFAQAKLVSAVSGKVLDVAVDIRKGSPTYGKYVAVEISDENKLRLFIPRGFAHAFITLSDKAIFQYKCDNFYNKESEAAIRFDDPTLNIDWRVAGEKIIASPKDGAAPYFEKALNTFVYSDTNTLIPHE